MKIVKRLGIGIVTFVLVLLLAFNIYNFVSVKILKKDLASFGGYAILEVVTGSMEPTIHVGDLIIINTKEVNYQESDIVTFYDVDGSFVTHRIVSINGTEMMTKGDNNNTEDDPTEMDKVVGKYLFKISGAGKLLASFKSPFVLVMILIIGLLFCIFVSIDKEGNPILTEEEKELQEFREYQNKKSEEESGKNENLFRKKESIEQEIEKLFEEKRKINKRIRILLRKKSKLEKRNSNLNKKENR